MTTKTNAESFEERIEHLVREQIAAIRARAEAAVARGLGARAVGAAQQVPPPAQRPPKGPLTQRRTTEQVAQLAERLLAVVHAQPGQTMRLLAPQVGEKPSDLSVPVERLRSQGRLRTVGQRQFTRYFPTAPVPTPAG